MKNFEQDVLKILKNANIKKTFSAKKLLLEKRVHDISLLIQEGPLSNLAFFSAKHCPDQYVGKIAAEWNKDKTAEVFQRKKLFVDNKNGGICLNPAVENELKDGNILLLILESPHQDEFYQSTIEGHNKGEPIGPANGVTGDNIVKFIHAIFNCKFKDYQLVIMNAITHQCSLGISPMNDPEVRDAIFSDLWDYCDKIGQYPYRNNFKERLKEIIKFSNESKGKLVLINACTRGKTRKDPLYSLVEKGINDVIGERNIKHYRTTHPSSWYSSKNRHFTEIK